VYKRQIYSTAESNRIETFFGPNWNALTTSTEWCRSRSRAWRKNQRAYRITRVGARTNFIERDRIRRRKTSPTVVPEITAPRFKTARFRLIRHWQKHHKLPQTQDTGIVDPHHCWMLTAYIRGKESGPKITKNDTINFSLKLQSAFWWFKTVTVSEGCLIKKIASVYFRPIWKYIIFIF